MSVVVSFYESLCHFSKVSPVEERTDIALRLLLTSRSERQIPIEQK